MRAALLAMVVSSAFGCSFVSMTRAPRPDCTDSTIAPIADTLGIVAGAVGGVAVYGAMVNDGSIPGPRGYGGLGDDTLAAVVGAAPFIASAIYGYTEAHHCKVAKQEQGPVEVPHAAAESKEDLEEQADRRSRIAAQLAKQGEAAAASGDCSTAFRLGKRLRDLDDAAADAYVRDPGVAACLQPQAGSGELSPPEP
jgi:hypothetical protein